jgi:two-component system chemotaxis response regulator CheY
MGTAVLVVDDDDAIRESVAWVLRDEGYTVVEAPDGKPALERLREHPQGMVVLLDLNMPGVDGFEVMKAVEEQKALASRHIYIVMSANWRPLPQTIKQQLARLFIPILPKPFEVDELLAVVATAASGLA